MMNGGNGSRSNSRTNGNHAGGDHTNNRTSHNNNKTNNNITNKEKISDWARFVPLRLNTEERALLDVLDRTLHVSEYTDHVDVSSASYRRSGNKARRILEGVLEVCHIATGLADASGLQQQQQKQQQSRSTSSSRSREKCSSGGGGGGADAATAANEEEEEEELPTTAGGKKMKKKKMKTKKGNKERKNGRADIPPPSSAEQSAPTNNNNRSSSSSSSSSWSGREPRENALLFQTMFEIGRRNKVLNPSSMRTTYGKLMYLLQDAQNPTVARSLGFSLHKDMVLVGPYLHDRNCGDLLYDGRLECAIQYISDRDPMTGDKLPREQVQAMVEGKRHVTNELITSYSKSSNGALSEDDVRRAIESLADAVAYVESNVRPVQCMLQYLEDNFDPQHAEKGFSLALHGSYSSSSSSSLLSSPYSNRYGLSAYSNSGSNEGPTLSHSHSTQYTFVWQSLRLWEQVQRHMHRLWVCADDDLLSTTSTYHLYNTGQGLNRVQQCPRVRRVMTSLLHQTQQETTTASSGGGIGGSSYGWVGLSVIHLGDRDVPNALIFIDKYTQIPRFLSPIVSFVQSIHDTFAHDPRLKSYVVKRFGSTERLKKLVLADYFKHGFDGSGDDGGSCIDGRLTSSWNWTSRLAKKDYYHAFMLSGFQGFDGDFR